MKLLYAVLISFLISPLCAFSQDDFGIWSSLELNTSLSKSIDVGFEGQARFDNNVTRMKELFISPSIKWDVVKHLRIGADYRLSNIPYNSKTSNRINTHRYTLDITFKNIIELFAEKPKFGLSMRLRGTSEFESQKRTQNYLRYSIKVDYNIKGTKLEPFVAAEMFYHFNDQLTYTFSEVKSTHSINKLRFKCGIDYPLKKNSTVKLFGQYQRELASQENIFVLAAGYSYELDFKKK